MKNDDSWKQINLDDVQNFTEFTGNTKFSYLDTQAQKWLEPIQFPIFVRTGTPERPLRDINNPKWHTEMFAQRIDNAGKLFICIGESFTWTENLYGLASGVNPPRVNPIIQLLFTTQGRIAQRFNADLRTVTYPGNSNSLMIQALDRVLTELKENQSLYNYEQIIVLQQFTDRSRCELNHPETPWLKEWQTYRDEQQLTVDNLRLYKEFEIFLIKRLEYVITKYNDFPIKYFVWRNFNPWITNWENASIKKIPLSMEEYKYIIQGVNVPNFPIHCAAGYYTNAINDVHNSKGQEWLLSEASLAEIQYNWFSNNEFNGHPPAELASLWTEYLIDQGVKFEV